jgi:DtxR family Mn-dependent transcriptional regulator
VGRAAAPRRHSADDYLETIYFLASPHGEYRADESLNGSPTMAARVAELLGVSRVSAGEMLRRMEANGLVVRGAAREAILTDKGRLRAEGLARRHRLLERLLTDLMGLSPADAHERADDVGDPFTDAEMDALAARLGRPDRCPHGWPIDPEAERAEDRQLRRLADLAPPTSGHIVRLLEHDGVLLRWLYEEGLTPGRRFIVAELHPAAGEYVLSVDGERRTLGERAARALLVRPEEPGGRSGPRRSAGRDAENLSARS